MLVLSSAFLAALLTGCGPERDVSSIEPVPSSRDVSGPRLGARGVAPLSFGPGDKGSPSWSPSGDRVAFIVDGYVADKTLSSETSSRRTTRDLGAERMTWPASGEELAILGDGSPSGNGGDDKETHPLYVTRSGEGELNIERLTKDALAISSSSADEPLVAALRSGPYESRISAVDAGAASLETYPEPIEGRVTEVSVSPGGDRALATVVAPSEDGGSERYEIHAYDLDSGTDELVTRLDAGTEVFGAPQQTSDGIYYVAGERETGQGQTEEAEIQYSLYRLPVGSDTPEPASGVGQDFIASSMEASPDGDRLALLGRRDSGSATNLYVLDLSDDSLYAATGNESMEIKTGADSLDWNPDGASVAIVARSAISEPKVYNGSASSLLANFYNLYQVPVDDLEARSED